MPKKETPKKKPVKKAKEMGRPPKMNAAIFEKLCVKIESSRKGLDTHAKKLNTSASAFYLLMNGDDSGKLSKRYARAREIQSHYFNDQILEVAFDDTDDEKPFVGVNHIQRDKLKIEALRLASARANPKKYGDKIEVDQKTEHTIKFK